MDTDSNSSKNRELINIFTGIDITPNSFKAFFSINIDTGEFSRIELMEMLTHLTSYVEENKYDLCDYLISDYKFNNILYSSLCKLIESIILKGSENDIEKTALKIIKRI
ncbi:hypothetical protein [Pectobacterium carotovorum]|uniref:hypothetical protein n=1 Tax=Pectobacterium carotovorum TaxID=554 RepID=UPI0021162289|nr:hypothetical protein [Pectobacterium carotovorum]MCQ8231494.1 hypothetical protein [Pectobacterium carotovorum]